MLAGRVYPIKFNFDGAACTVESLSILGGTTNQCYNRSGGAVTLSNDGRYLTVGSIYEASDNSKNTRHGSARVHSFDGSLTHK